MNQFLAHFQVKIKTIYLKMKLNQNREDLQLIEKAQKALSVVKIFPKLIKVLTIEKKIAIRD